mmetsp:Transcript_14589/g.40542  ORF Transcript_14589/g.40542 Transcript_14589/m.40542 type:complete len:1076 (+) Transcript_14589:299-3526(+)|eukprot:CAMPEP_0172366480 /NCGR_PEP_ID=MMETSP1060-20121228/15542_1 /TAXON_ID=37318 /ORGANISM="Pseudo-nitzschia pungens, Strain cf. cingulata" /LENGTH=1075 /DNA_ID=CAMNT_0013090357 /DNA_START=237 /DNA_END=3464 /DNA_ORIENTATION=-
MAVPTIILINEGRGAYAGCQTKQTKARCEMNDTPPISVGFPSTTTSSETNMCANVAATRNHNYFTKIMAVTVLAAYLVSSASAFSHTQNQIGVSLGKRMSFVTPARTEFSLGSLLSTRRTRVVLTAESGSSASSSKSDQKEWKAVFLALQLYKAAYGDLKVPARFVVPSVAPWPEAAWGMKLGQKVGAIRETGLYVDNSKKRRQQLEKLGFVWMLRAPTDTSIPFDQIYDALTVYRAEIKPSGPLTVPTEFSVPDAEPWPESTRGLPLGRSMKQLRSKAYLKANPGAAEKLKQIGFETDKKLSANDKRFQAVYLALERYKETYDDLLVPQPFVVPSDSAEWPEESWGLRLGARVNAIRSQGTFIKNNAERQDMLDALGFVWTPPEKETKKRGRKTLDQIDQEEKEALLEASSKSGKTMGSSSADKNAGDDDADSFLSFFDFKENDQDNSDSDDTQGQPTWGLEAGRELDGLPNNNKRDVAEQEFDEDYEAPRTLGESLGAARVRALEAGVIEDTDSKRPTKRKREPDIPWFNDDFGGYFVFEDVVEALTLYKKGYGDFSNLTSGEFVIPVKDEPEHSFDDDFDDDMSMNGMDDRAMTDDEIEAEILRLERGIISTEDVEGSTDIKELDWPEHLEGMRLGDIVERMRDGSLEVKHLPERKAQLDAIGFDWGEDKYFLDVPFEKAICAMYAFYMVRGDMFVPADYVMPDEDPWPRALAGYELGKAVRRIRELQNFFEAFHVEKVALLRMIDFVWFPTLALPIDPDEPQVSAEMLLLGALGHPDYHQLDEFPMGLPEKIMADGPFHVSDDPREWWRTWHNWDYVADIWTSMGTRDRAVALRKSGYPRMAKEHEEKYGPGLFQQINEFLENMLLEIGDEELGQMIAKEDQESFNGVVDQYNQLIQKWDGLTHDERMDAPGIHLTNFTLYGRKGGLPAILKVFTDTFEDSERQRTDLSDKLLDIRDTLFNYLDEIADCTDMDDFELDVLWRFRIKLYLSLVLSDHFNTKAMDRQKQEATARQINEMESQIDTQLMSFGTDEEDFEEELAEDEFEVEEYTEAINGAEFGEEEEVIEEEVGI